MIRYTLLIILALLILSCNRKQPDTSLPLPASMDIPQKADSATTLADSHFFWTADLDQKGGLVMKKLFPINKDSLSVSGMIVRMNEEFPEIQLKYRTVLNDTLFLKINKASYLTQQMGTSGAEAYLAELTFNMTEVDGINAVGISFKAGDHAQPGIYTRTDFIHGRKK